MHKIISISALLLFANSLTAAQHWVPLNPGAGGQVQDIVADPNQANVVYIASDMEGVYKSTDNGENWHITGNLVNNRVFGVSVMPGDSNAVLVGTLYGLHTSDDGGQTYSLVEQTKNISISSIAFKPDAPNHIIAANGWRDDDDFIGKFGESSVGPGVIFKSADGGNTWQKVIFDADETTDRNVYSVVYNPTNSNHVYIGSNKGVFKSTDAGATWSKLDSPSADRPKNKGLTISPEGNAIYAVYASDASSNRDWHLYASPTDTVAWQAVVDDLPDGKRYWYPEVDPRSSGNEHKVLLGALGDRFGIFEGTFNWNEANQLADYSWQQIFGNAANNHDGTYDIGWDFAIPPNARVTHYTPIVSGGERGVWSTTNQTMFYASFDEDAGTYQWHNKYSNPNNDITVNWWGQDWPTYSGKGTESTYTYDVAIHENYVIQGQADNGFVESWDGGFSWSNMQHRRAGGFNLSDVQAVDIANAWGTPTVVAQATSGYGGGAHNGRLWAKKLVNHDPTDVWVELAGGPTEKAGLAKGVLRDVAVSPVNPAKVFMFSANYGMYMIEDIGRALSYYDQGKELPVKQIYSGLSNQDDARNARTIAPHPTNEKVVFFSSTGGKQGVWRGEEQEDGSWQFAQVLATTGWDAEVSAWEHNGKVYLMNFAKGGGPEFNDGNNWHVMLSTDEGETWTKVFNPANAMALRPTSNVAWWDAVGAEFNFGGKGGSAGYANKMVLSYYDHSYQNGYGVFMGTIAPDGTISWQDATGDLHFSGMTNSRFTEVDGMMRLYSATPGAGLWRTDLPGVELPSKPSSKPNDASTLTTSLNEDTNTITLMWADNAENEQGFRIERSIGEESYVVIGQVGRDDTDFVDFDLADFTEYNYRIVAFNDVDTASPSNVSTITSGETVLPPEVCDVVHLVSDGTFEAGMGAWNLYVNGGNNAVATADSVVQDGFGNGKSLLVDIEATSNTNDIQLQRGFGTLESNTPYKLEFTAKSAEPRSMQVKIHQTSSPWWNVQNAEVIELTVQPQSFSIDYLATSELGNLNLGFFLGDFAVDVSIDDVSLYLHCPPSADIDAPASLSGAAAGSDTIDATWAAVEGAESYHLQIQQGSGGWTDVSTNTTQTSYTITGLESDQSYTLRVRTTVQQEFSAWTESAEVELVSLGTCDASNLVADGNFEQGMGAWSLYVNTNNGASAEGTVSAQSGFGSGQSLLIDIDQVSGTNDIQLQRAFGTFEPNKAYKLNFTAKASADRSLVVKVHQANSPWWNVQDAETIQLTEDSQSFSIDYFTESEMGDLKLGFFLGDDSADVSIDNVSLQLDCAPVIDVPAPSSVSAAIASSTAINVNWASVEGASYDLQQKQDDGEWTDTATNIDQNTYSLTNLATNHTYTLRVRARQQDDVSDWVESAPIELTGSTGEFGNPKDFSVLVTSTSSVTLSWNSVFDAVTYDVQRQLSTESTWRKAEYDITATTLDITDLGEGAFYTFRVKARRESGSASGWTTSELIELVPVTDPIAGDFDGDGILTMADMMILRGAMGACSGHDKYAEEMDLQADGCINFLDFGKWVAIYRTQ